MKKIILAFLFVGLIGITSAQTETPAAPLPVDMGQIENYVATAAAQANQLPSDITAPNGIALVPDNDNSLLFSYAKWLFSTNTAYELLGQTLAPFAINFFLLLMMLVALTILWFIIVFLVLLFRFIMWVVRLILQFLEIVSNVAASFLKYIGL